MTSKINGNWPHSLFVGLDDFLQRPAFKIPTTTSNYPPYNIVKVDQNHYRLDMAVAGFDLGQIDIEVNGTELIIKGKAGQTDEETTFIYKGLAARDFTRTFSMLDTIRVVNANLVNGILSVFFENQIPEHMKPRKVEINVPQPKAADHPQLLTEDSDI